MRAFNIFKHGHRRSFIFQLAFPFFGFVFGAVVAVTSPIATYASEEKAPSAPAQNSKHSPTIILGFTNELLPDACGSFGPQNDGRLPHASRLVEPFYKDNHRFDWSIGREDAVTYYDIKSLSDDHYEVVLYFKAIDLLITLQANSVLFDEVTDSSPPEELGVWYGDLWFRFTDTSTRNVTEFAYGSRVDDINNILANTSRNIRLERIEQGKSGCTQWW